MPNDVEQSLSFDRVARLYDEQRPGYPAELFDDLIAEASLSKAVPLLEIGAGTGRATLPFLDRGFEVHAIEPGAAMAEQLVAHVAPEHRFKLQQSKFEAAELGAGRFPLVYCAQAYHWLDPGTRLQRIARCLRADGTLAVIGNAPQISDSPVHDAIQQVYRQIWPENAGRENDWYASAESPVMGELLESEIFEAPRAAHYRHSVEYTAPAYSDLMRTQSNHQMLPPAKLDALVGGIEHAIREGGGTIVVEHIATAFVARRAR
jgi:SAM-dependent methyltransferase